MKEEKEGGAGGGQFPREVTIDFLLSEINN